MFLREVAATGNRTHEAPPTSVQDAPIRNGDWLGSVRFRGGASALRDGQHCWMVGQWRYWGSGNLFGLESIIRERRRMKIRHATALALVGLGTSDSFLR